MESLNGEKLRLSDFGDVVVSFLSHVRPDEIGCLQGTCNECRKRVGFWSHGFGPI